MSELPLPSYTLRTLADRVIVQLTAEAWIAIAAAILASALSLVPIWQLRQHHLSNVTRTPHI
jgi:hypothetical protein